MNRSSKIVISILLMILSLGIVGGTVYFAKNSNGNPSGSMNMGGNMQSPPSMGDNNNGGTPPDKPGEDNSSSNDNSNSDNSSNDSERPEMPSGGMQGGRVDGGSNEMPSMNSTSLSSLSTGYIVVIAGGLLVFSGSVLYLIFSKAGSVSVIKSTDKFVISLLSTVILTGGLTFGVVYFTNNYLLTSSNNAPQMQENGNGGSTNSSNVSASGATTIDGEDKEESSKTYESSTSDESAILVTNKGNFTLTDATVNKTGDTSNTESSEFYGVNAAFLVQTNSTATIKNTTITTNSKGSNAVFATGENAKITVSDTTIETSSDSSRGLDATYGGTIEAENVKITTQGNSCATLATDRGEGTVTASNSTLETNGKGSPIIYSTGDITLNKSTGVSNGSQMVVVEGKNSATVNNSTLTASGIGNRNNVDNAGIMIYQSMSGDAAEGSGTFTAKNSKLSISSDSSVYKTAPMFFVTNTTAKINLTNTTLNYGSGILLSIKGTDEWGNSGSNGGNVTFKATKENLTGDIEVDKISTLKMTLKNSTYKGTINGDNTAKKITLKLDSNSKITLTGDSYVTSLEDEDSSYSNIDFNGYKLYVNGKAIN